MHTPDTLQTYQTGVQDSRVTVPQPHLDFLCKGAQSLFKNAKEKVVNKKIERNSV